ncbi:MAG: hypothetical protein L0Y32_06270, partial [Nevskiales bacterium]|nr:hypothetical protein [Nevskiales bacterium]
MALSVTVWSTDGASKKFLLKAGATLKLAPGDHVVLPAGTQAQFDQNQSDQSLLVLKSTDGAQYFLAGLSEETRVVRLPETELESDSKKDIEESSLRAHGPNTNLSSPEPSFVLFRVGDAFDAEVYVPAGEKAPEQLSDDFIAFLVGAIPPAPPGPNDNDPVITSNGGAATATVSVAENSTAVTTVTAT